jgi:hypothetical protein
MISKKMKPEWSVNPGHGDHWGGDLGRAYLAPPMMLAAEAVWWVLPLTKLF